MPASWSSTTTRRVISYYIASDARNYYQATDAAKLQGCESVTISVTCSDGATLGQGTTQYKCRKCGKSLNAHSKECAMQTTVTENELDLSELDAMLQEAENQVAALQSQINALENENADLLKKKSPRRAWKMRRCTDSSTMRTKHR